MLIYLEFFFTILHDAWMQLCRNVFICDVYVCLYMYICIYRWYSLSTQNLLMCNVSCIKFIVCDIWKITEWTYASISDLVFLSLIYSLYLCHNYIHSSIIIFSSRLGVFYFCLLTIALVYHINFGIHFFNFYKQYLSGGISTGSMD